MLTAEEEKFLHYWQANREREKKLLRQARAGVPIGLSVGAGILICVFSGWYERAMMEMNAEVSPTLLIFAVILIAVLFSIFTQKQKWDMNEQTYLGLLAKIKRERQKNGGEHPAEPAKEPKKEY